MTQTRGVSFVGDHSGLITNCYGWYGDGDVTHKAPVFETKTGKITSSYFVNINDREGLADLYNYKGAHSEVSPSQISADSLNTDAYHAWVLDAKSYKTYAYDTDLRPGFYPYPRLRTHYGDWVREIQYAYGVVYYEQYEGGDLSYTIKDLSNPNETVEGELNGFKTLDGNSVKLKGNEAEIEETGYILFYNAQKCPYDTELLGELLPKTHPICEAMGTRYVCAKLKTDKPIVEVQAQVQFSSDMAEGDETELFNSSIYVVPNFADAIVPSDNKIYKVRTPEQLSHVGDEAYRGAKFVQNHDIEVQEITEEAVVDIFIGTYTTEDNSELRIHSAPNGWMNTVYKDSSVSLHHLILDDLADAPIFGTVNGTVKDFTVTAPTASVSLVGEVSSAGTISGITMEIPTITVNDGTDTFGAVAVNAVQGATVVDTTLKTDTIIVNDLTATVGGLVGTNAGTISGGKIQSMEGENPVVITLGDDTKTDDRTLTVGGLVGENTGTIQAVTRKKSQTVSSANVDIRYAQVYAEPKAGEDEPAKLPQPEVETIAIGGLVGSNTGAISDASVIGSISTNAPAAAKTVVIGGAVAYGGGTSYQNITAEVKIDEKWAGAALIGEPKAYFHETLEDAVRAVNPSALGPVGQFVGYVTSGSYVNCSSSGCGTTAYYQFLGQIEGVDGTMDKYYQVNTDKDLPDYELSSALLTEKVEEWIPDEGIYDADDKYRAFNATMENCSFDLPNDETPCYQTVDGADLYFYGLSGRRATTNYQTTGPATNVSYSSKILTASEVGVFGEQSKNNSNKEVDTGLYYLADGVYYRVYVKNEEELLGAFNYAKFYYYTSNNKTQQTDRIYRNRGNYSDTTKQYATRSVALNNGTYVLVSEDTSKILGLSDGAITAMNASVSNGVVSFSETDTDLANGYMWTYGSKAMKSSKDDTKYLTLTLPAITERSYPADDLSVAMTVDGFSEKYKMYNFEELGNVYTAIFSLDEEFNHICTYTK